MSKLSATARLLVLLVLLLLPLLLLLLLLVSFIELPTPLRFSPSTVTQLIYAKMLGRLMTLCS